MVEAGGTAMPSVTILPANEPSAGAGSSRARLARDCCSKTLHVGSRSIFAAAGFSEVAHPTLRRVVMRIEF